MTDIEKDVVWQLLTDIKNDVKDLDNKWEQHLIDSVEDRANIQNLCVQVNALNKLIVHGNGQESIMVRLEQVQTCTENLKEDITEIKTSVIDMIKSKVNEGISANNAKNSKWSA